MRIKVGSRTFLRKPLLVYSGIHSLLYIRSRPDALMYMNNTFVIR